MNKNWLNVWRLPFRKRYYLLHLIKLFKHVLRSFRYAHMRATKGFCYGDVWEFGSWFMDLAPQMLRIMANQGMAYPGCNPFETPEKWHDWLNNMADKIEQTTEEYYFEHNNNEFKEKFEEICRSARKRAEGEELIFTDEEEEIKNKYFNREKELEEERSKLFKEAMSELIEHWDCLWD